MPPALTRAVTATAWRGPRVGGAGHACRVVPPSRWDVEVGWHGEGALSRRFGAFVDSADLFDARAFGIAAPEAAAMDAQQRLLLEAAHEALAGASPRALSAFSATSGTLSAACGRISYTLGLKGPSVSIDTACSSSLVGVHLVVSSFLGSACPRALVAGVNLTLRAETTAVLSRAGMLAADGRCKTLDAGGDGYARAEACVVHLLEAFSERELAHTPLQGHALYVHGTSVNQDGRSSSLTAPNGPSQQQVVGAAAEVLAGAAGAKARRPLELQAAKCRLLHAEPAAGALGLSALAQRLQQAAGPAMLHLRALNAYLAPTLHVRACVGG
ncbi:hypothetical protein WJX81_008145 [Elliptochloris bilobata]|uniref:Ketosynthase family 3 (KS3) domain-containing protein n=1 Tax=Elliptochloris bilobata TaxID=381761 RepID=A0AAW1S7P8_9CHLO